MQKGDIFWAKLDPVIGSETANEGGLRNESKVKANQIRTIDKSRLGNKIGQLNSTKMKAVELAILIHLDIF